MSERITKQETFMKIAEIVTPLERLTAPPSVALSVWLFPVACCLSLVADFQSTASSFVIALQLAQSDGGRPAASAA